MKTHKRDIFQSKPAQIFDLQILPLVKSNKSSHSIQNLCQILACIFFHNLVSLLVTEIIAIESVQRDFTKRIPGCAHLLSYAERISFLKLQSLEHRRLIAGLTMAYNMSVLGPILFISYSAEVVAIVQHQGFKVHAFADNLQIYGSTAQNGAADLMAHMSICIECVASWMSSNQLRLNPSKTELIWLGASRLLQHCDGFNMTVCDADVRPVDCVRDLGVLIDSNMTLSNHVNNMAGICFYQLRQLRIIRRSLTTDAAHSLVRAQIHTRVDYCNELLAAGPKYLHEKLQSVLRAAARLVLQLPHRASVSEIMRGQLHWLEMPDRVRFKLCTLVYRCLHGLAPHYLSDLCTPATVHAHLRSSVTLERSLSIPRTKTKTIGPRGFYTLLRLLPGMHSQCICETRNSR